MITLVLLPGLDGTGLLFEKFVESIILLSTQITTIVISYPSNNVLSYQELEEYVFERLPKDQPYFLLGESFSGPIAISIAATRPSSLLGLILSCSFAKNPQPLFFAFKPITYIMPIRIVPIWVQSFFVLGRFSSQEIKILLSKALKQVAPNVFRFRVRAVLSVDVLEKLKEINVPIIYLRATEDRLVPKSASELIIKNAPNAKILNFIGPHFLLQILPLQTAEAVIEFISKYESPNNQV